MKKLTFCAMLFLGLTIMGLSGAKATDFQGCMHNCTQDYYSDGNVGKLNQCWLGCDEERRGNPNFIW